jgi:hypothetical protein
MVIVPSLPPNPVSPNPLSDDKGFRETSDLPHVVSHRSVSERPRNFCPRNFGKTLFETSVDADAIQAAQQANSLSNNSRFADLHTLACLYAAQGKTTEAKQVLLQAMDAAVGAT